MRDHFFILHAKRNGVALILQQRDNQQGMLNNGEVVK